MNSKKLPHYVADYEFSARIRSLSYPIVCALDAKVFTKLDWGNSRKDGNNAGRVF